MGSYAELYVGRLLVASSKNDIFPDVVGLFQRDEFYSLAMDDSNNPEVLFDFYRPHLEEYENEEGSAGKTHFYKTTLSEISERLAYLGYSKQNSIEAFYAWRDSNVAWKRRLANEYRKSDPYSIQEKYRQEAEQLSHISVDMWIDATKELIACGKRKHLSENAKHILNLVGGDHEYDYGPSYDFLISLRIICDYAKSDEVVCYDVTGLVHAGYLDAGNDPIGAMRDYEFDNAADIFRNSKTIVLVEGKSDIRILKAAMTAVFPRLADRFIFFDYEEFGIPGGAGNLVNLVKSFVAAGVANRIVALFDNDTGATESLLSLKDIALPRNLKVIKLPNLKFLENYPTVGPSGEAQMSISGTAAGIELYLGNDVLTRRDGSRREVRWTGYSKKLEKYQGELVEKSAVQDLFLKKLEASTTAQLRQDSNMEHIIEILKSIINAFNDELKADIIRYSKDVV